MATEYHKIQSLFKRRTDGALLLGEYAVEAFAYLADAQWQFTEKVDGTNIRVMWSGEAGAVVFGGKTDNAQMPVPLMKALLDLFPPEKLRAAFGESDATLYGEGYGARIQKGGGHYRPDPSFVLFDVLCGGLWLNRDNVHDVAVQLACDCVPLVGTGTLHDLVACVQDGVRSRWGDFEAEGLVARPACELRTRRGDRVITKLKTRDFQRIA